MIWDEYSTLIERTRLASVHVRVDVPRHARSPPICVFTDQVRPAKMPAANVLAGPSPKVITTFPIPLL